MMKKWVFLILLVSGIWITVSYMNPFSDPKVEIQTYKAENIVEKETPENTLDITLEDVHQGNLLLVNNENPVHESSIKSDVINLAVHPNLTQGYVLLGDIYLSEAIAHKFATMLSAAQKEGPQFFAITSGFRNFEEQNGLYQKMGADYALPAGYSEHNLGLSLDVGSTQKLMAEAPEGKWIEKNAWKHGFILRYPADKTAITGIQYEPWHIRYVGLPHSVIMEEKHLVLEEYLDYLKEEKKISAVMDGKKYTITYYPITETTSIPVPAKGQYEISGNNMDGVIVTEYE